MSDLLVTVVVSYQRLALLQRTLESYWETVSLPHSLVVVDNHSDDDVRRWLETIDDTVIFLERNYYPGYAANRGWEFLLDEHPDATLLHRSDNDMEYQPGWCEEVVEQMRDDRVWQVGLRTVEEEGPQGAVGGNSVLRRAAWDAGLRYGEAPWNEVAFEDGHLSNAIMASGHSWVRVLRPCALHVGHHTPADDAADPYYGETMRVRGLL